MSTEEPGLCHVEINDHDPNPEVIIDDDSNNVHPEFGHIKKHLIDLQA